MPTKRVMVGLADLTGEQIGTLKVGDMTARRPEPRYRTTCTECGVESTESQSRLTSGAARCLAAGHGKAQRPRGRNLLSEQRQQIAQREAEREAEAREASARRMEAESEGYERPTKYSPTPEPYQPMSERERLALRERREAEEAERREADRPRIEAERRAAEEQEEQEAAQHERIEKQRAYWAEWVQSDRDPKLFVSDAMRNAKMPTKDAEAFTVKAATQFAAEPEYTAYKTLDNADIILRYLRRNGVFIADVETIRAAFRRLRDLGLLKQRPAPQPQPAVQPKRVNLDFGSPAPKTPTGPTVYRGRDYVTGLERDFTEREVARMSSLEYQRAFQVVQTVSELFTTMSESG